MRQRYSLIALILLISAASTAVAQQQRLTLVEDLTQGMQVTAQGCVKPGEGAGTWVFTQVMTWPIVRTQSGPHGPRHLAIQMTSPTRLEEYLGDTVQLSGRIIDVRKSEIETEPGLHRFGSYVEFERPDRNVLVRPEELGLEMRGRSRDDISITLLEFEVADMLRVKRGCLPQSGDAAFTARRR